MRHRDSGPDGLPVMDSPDGNRGMIGVLTTDHAASSYGQPVYVPEGDRAAYGPAEAGRLWVSVKSIEFPEWRTISDAAVAVGFDVEVADLDALPTVS